MRTASLLRRADEVSGAAPAPTQCVELGNLRLDLEARVVTAYRLENGRWAELGTWGDETDARLEPFDALSIDVTRWWG